MSTETADAFKQACKDYGFGPEQILPHGSYLINLASAKPELLDKSYTAFVDELKRCEMLGITWASNCTVHNSAVYNVQSTMYKAKCMLSSVQWCAWLLCNGRSIPYAQLSCYVCTSAAC